MLKTVRLNNHFFQSRKRMTADNTGHPQTRPSVLRNAWFIVFPVLVLAFFTHWFIYIAMKGTGSFSTLLPEGHPGHVSWAEAWWMFAEILAVCILWFSTAAWVCVMVERHPSIRYKLAWEASASSITFSLPVCLLHETAPEEHNQRRAAAMSSLADPDSAWRLRAWPPAGQKSPRQSEHVNEPPI